MKTHSEISWSLLDTKPICLYIKHCDGHIIYWNGIGTSKRHGLIVLATVWNNIWPTPLMKKSAWDEFNRIYRLNGFETTSWDRKLLDLNADSYLSYLKIRISRNDFNFWTDLRNKYSAKDALTWFNPENEIVK